MKMVDETPGIESPTIHLISTVPLDRVDKMVDESRTEMLVKTAAKTIVYKF